MGLVIVTVIAAPVSAAIGLGFGVVLERLLAPVRDELGDPDLGVPERVAMRCGVWLLITGALALLFAIPSGSALGRASSAAMLVIASSLALAGALRRAWRRSFLARVARGREPGWAIVSLSSIDDSTGVPRFDRAPRGHRVLVRVETAGHGAYRASSHARPWAVLSAKPPLEPRPPRRRPPTGSAQPEGVDLLAVTSR